MVLFFELMVKIFSILLVLVMLGKTFNIHFNDFIKINELIEHASFHAEQYGDDFFEFLSKHYGDLKQQHKKQHQEEEHHHLPFDHHDCKINSTTLVYVVKKELLVPSIVIKHTKETSFLYKDPFSTFEKEEIFQPPKLV